MGLEKRSPERLLLSVWCRSVPTRLPEATTVPAIVMSIRPSKDSHLRKCPVLAGTAIWELSGDAYNRDLHTFAGTEDKPEEGYRSRYDKSTEKASAGYYSVFLSDYKIQAEATALPHSGMLRFTFPESKEARIQVDLARRVGGTSTLQSVEVGWDRTPINPNLRANGRIGKLAIT